MFMLKKKRENDLTISLEKEDLQFFYIIRWKNMCQIFPKDWSGKNTECRCFKIISRTLEGKQRVGSLNVEFPAN